MVKFGAILESQSVEEFRPNYVGYARLKRHIEKCAYLRSQWLKYQKKNFGLSMARSEDSDEEQVAGVMREHAKDAIANIRKSHNTKRMASVESKERLDALTLNLDGSQDPSSIDLERGRGGGEMPHPKKKNSRSSSSAATEHIDNELPLVLPPPAITSLASSTKSPINAAGSNRSISSERRAKAFNFQDVISNSSSNSSNSNSNSNSNLKSLETSHTATTTTPTETTSLLGGSQIRPPRHSSSASSSVPIVIPPSVPIPTTSIHPRNSKIEKTKRKQRKKSLSPTRKERGGEASPLLRHIAAKTYDTYASSEELSAFTSLEVEIEKFWDMIEADLNKVDSFFEGKVAEYEMTLESFYVHESAMGMTSPERKGRGSR